MLSFILAGGFATRLWPLTERRAKPLLPLAGKPLLTHLVEEIPQDIPVTISTNAAFGEAMRAWAAAAPRSNIEIIEEHAASEREKLGALGALAQWITERAITDDVLVLAGDNVLGFRLRDVLTAMKPGCALVAAHDVHDVGRASSFGTIVLGDDGRTVTAFEEKPAHPRSTLISTGCFTLPASCLPLICDYARSRPDDMGGALEALVQAGKPVHCITPPGAWFDVGTFDAYLDATSSLVGERVLTGKDAAAERCTTHGSVVLGDGSIARDSQLTDVVVFDRCVIEDCILERCVIDDDCVLRGVDLTGKMLRAGTTLTRGESV